MTAHRLAGSASRYGWGEDRDKQRRKGNDESVIGRFVIDGAFTDRDIQQRSMS
jgi:hypothetical protein